MAWLSSLLGTDVDRHRQMGQTLAADYFSDLRVTAERSSFHSCLSFSKYGTLPLILIDVA